jgi:tetratricopeptide (TPR) repeat protein
VTIARTTGETGRLDLARALIRRGENERKANELGKAESDDREALSILESAYGPNDVRVVPAVTELGLLLSVTDPEQAMRLYRRSYDLLMANQGDEDGDAPVLLQNIGSMQMRARRYQDARATLEEALPRLVKYYGPKDPHIGAVYSNLADVHRNLGNYAHSVELAQQALEVDTAVSGPEHPDVGIDWLKLARCNDKLGNPEQALQQIDKAIAIFGKALPPDHPTSIEAANYKARFLIEFGRHDEARQLLDSFILVQPGGLSTRRSLLAGQVILAEVERLDGQWPKSQALAERVLTDPAAQGERSLEASARWARACALAMQRQTAEADLERARALKIETTGGNGIPFPGVLALAKSYACAGDSARALEILRESVAKGFGDPSVLHDPVFAATRDLPEFAPVAAAIAPRHSMAAPRAPD